MRYMLGYSFVITILVVLVINVTMILWVTLVKYIKGLKKFRNQRSYEARFWNYAKIERLSYVLQLNRLTEQN